jgi:hypothetical protein
MMEAVRTSETSVDNNFTRQYIPEDDSGNIHWLSIAGLETPISYPVPHELRLAK